MKVFIATDIRVILCGGRIYARGQHSTILRRYYTTFGSIVLCSRFQRVERMTEECEDITPIVADTIEMPSLAKMLLGRCDVEMKEAMQDCDLVIARCPAVSAYKAADCARKLNKPYFAESMGCAWDAYWNHGLVGKAIASYMFFKMKSVVKNADYALYVTSEFLQKRYPCKNESVAASNVLIQSIDEGVLQKRLEKIENSDPHTITLMTTAAIDVRYKGQEYVIKAIPALNKAGIKVKYLLVGGGDPSYLQGVARACGVEDQVEFVGRLSLSEVFETLDQADIYIQPSLQEGLPRSVIEAMSRACPVIGARTAGIPELISPECVVKRKSSKDVVEKIVCLKDRNRLSDLAKINFQNSKQYLDNVLKDRRDCYYRKIREEIIVHDDQ